MIWERGDVLVSAGNLPMVGHTAVKHNWTSSTSQQIIKSYSITPLRHTPHPLLPIPYSLLPAPCSLLPTPYSLLPTPRSLFNRKYNNNISYITTFFKKIGTPSINYFYHYITQKIRTQHAVSLLSY